MTHAEIAIRLWAALCLAAKHHQTVQYGEVAPLVGTAAIGLSGPLEMIQNYCLSLGAPGLTVLVVGKDDGKPKSGFTAASDHDAERRRVFDHDWTKVPLPKLDELAAFKQKV